MYIVDGIVYAGEQKKPIHVISVKALDNYKLWLRFSNGEEKVFDCKPLLSIKLYAPLKDDKTFRSVFINYGVTAWNDGKIDIAPETLYHTSIKYES